MMMMVVVVVMMMVMMMMIVCLFNLLTSMFTCMIWTTKLKIKILNLNHKL